MDKRCFEKLGKAQKVEFLRLEATFVANRQYQGFIVSLFHANGLYIELWKRVGLDYVDYVEVVNELVQTVEYLKHFNVRSSLGL
jgi:hypothetical protein